MPRKAILSDGDHIEFDVFGKSGPFVFLGPQLYINSPMPGMEEATKDYVEALSGRYRVILANWPRGTGNSSRGKARTMHKDHGIRDIHAIADAAGAETFAWWGYSFGAAFGLQLARNNARISAFVCAGFPPLWQPLSDMLGAVRGMKRVGPPPLMREVTANLSDFSGLNEQSIAFYESVAGQDDWEAAGDITCPRLVLHDVDDTVELMGLKHDLSARTRAAEEELKRLGWEIAWIDTGQGHGAFREPKPMLAGFAPFLDRVLLGGKGM